MLLRLVCLKVLIFVVGFGDLVDFGVGFGFWLWVTVCAGWGILPFRGFLCGLRLTVRVLGGLQGYLRWLH